jgi:hypothetical protein
MSEEDYKAIIAIYQQKAFELFNTNIVQEAQLNSIKKTVGELTVELEKLKKNKRGTKVEDDFT